VEEKEVDEGENDISLSLHQKLQRPLRHSHFAILELHFWRARKLLIENKLLFNLL